MESTFYPITGIESIYIAGDIVDTAESYSAGTPEYFAPAANAEWAEEQSSKDAFYDNVKQDVFYGAALSSLVIRVSGISAQKDAEIRGKNYSAANGRVIGSGNSEPPLRAVGLKINKGSGNYVYIWFPKGRISGGKIIASTKTNDVTVNDVEYTFAALETAKQWTVNSITRGITWYKGDTTDAAFDGSSWFSQVQTPDTTSAPDAIALSSIVPASGASGILASANVVLTFNNKISTHNVVLVDDVTDAIVPVSITFDTTGKIMTLDPTSNMATGDKHAVAIFGVTDIYGQTLANSISYFTVA
jgi:phi13 family phage major tail protein